MRIQTIGVGWLNPICKNSELGANINGNAHIKAVSRILTQSVNLSKTMNPGDNETAFRTFYFSVARQPGEDRLP